MQSTLIVVSAEDGKRYKMVMKGDLGRLRIRKLKRYLESTTGTAVPDQVLCHGDDVLQDDYTGDEVGLYDGMVLMLTRKPPLRDIGTGFLGNVGWTGGDIDGLEAKKKQILMDRQRRNEDFERQKERVARTVFSTEHQRRRLELELMEREAKLRKLSEEEERVLCDRERLEQLRTAEHKREKLRIHGLEERQQQLEAEQERIRAIELKRLDVERKHKLVESSRRDYFLERERMDQEKFNFEDRLRQQELDIRQKELLLDRERIETERLQRQLDREKAVLLRQKRIEEGMSQKERCLEDRMLHDLACDAPPPLDAQYGTDLGPASASVGPFPPTHIMSRETELYSPAPTVSANASHSLLQTLPQPSSHGTGYRTGLVSSAPRVSISNSGMGPTVPVPHSSSLTTTDSYLLAEENLRLFAQDLGIHSLRFDENYTCVVSVEDKYTLLLTYDPATERLYLYSTLLTRLPKNTTSRLQLYEFLLEGALLGRDMSGGGVGVSIKNDFVLMATSILLPKSQPDTLRSIVPSFVENITRWRTRLREVLGVEASAVTDYDHPATISLHGTTNTHRGAYPMIGLEVTEGVVRNGVFTRYTDGVAVLSAHGPALAAGIYEGDVITSLNSVRVTSLRDLTFAVNSLLPGSTAAVGIQRRDRAMTLEVNVAASVYRPGMKQRNVVPVDRSPHVSPQRRL